MIETEVVEKGPAGSDDGERVAVVLLILGGPDSLEAVQPFLYNLFRDPAIITVPQPFRWILAQIISRRRAPFSRSLYAQIGGKSPILEETKAQAAALETALETALAARAADDVAPPSYQTFVATRYWHPFAAETVGEVAAFAPDRVILLPLYPQFSTTTIGSSVNDWKKAARQAGFDVPTDTICCYWDNEYLIRAHATAVAPLLRELAGDGAVRLLLSAHGLPQKVIDDGDPYAWQIDQTVAALVEMLASEFDLPDIDWRVCYQSRVGPLEWLKPATETEMRRAGADGVSVVLDPIAFVSEHAETLVELDVEYKRLAEDCGVPEYRRVPTLGTDENFIACLAGLVRERLQRDAGGAAPGCGPCPGSFDRCYRDRGR